MSGHGQKMRRDKTAIVKVDRVAFYPPAGHMTSSYWAAGIRRWKKGNRPVRWDRNSSEAQDLPLLNQKSGVLFVPDAGHFPRRSRCPGGNAKGSAKKHAPHV